MGYADHVTFPPPPPTGPPLGPPPAWTPYGMPVPPPPPRRRPGLVVAIVGLVVVLIGGVALATFLVVRANDENGSDEKAASAPTTTSSPSTSPGSSATTTTTPDGRPTPDGSESPGEDPSTGLTAPYAPTDDTDDDIHNDVKASDYPGDWDFRLGDVAFRATLVRSVDHASCAPVEKSGVLTRQRCSHAVQFIYDAFGGKARITQLFLVFEDQRRATAAQKTLTDKDLSLSADSTRAGGTNGRWVSSVYGNIAMVTVGTSTAAVPDRKLTRIINYMNADFKGALYFK